MAPKVNHYLKNVFPGKNKNIKVIGEPGRQISQSATALAVKVFLKKQQEDISHYYVNNGIYQGLGCVIIENEKYKPQLLIEDDNEVKRRFADQGTSYVWGQTCDGVDYLNKNDILPRIEQGDWLLYRNVGAYSNSMSCNFNGFDLPKTYYIN